MQATLTRLADSLEAARGGSLGTTQLVSTWRESIAAEPALPERYRQVAEKVLGQIESSALFTEESCSFSQGDMYDALADWLGHARRLAAA